MFSFFFFFFFFFQLMDCWPCRVKSRDGCSVRVMVAHCSPESPSSRNNWTLQQCGKTSIAFFICKIVFGVSINCNIDRGRIGIFQGEVINQRFVLFDDASSKGRKKLDELRDYLDGRIKVPLGKKKLAADSTTISTTYNNK